jgi:hypothetical protein
MLSQITEHYCLAESLDELGALSLSSLSKSLYEVYLFSKGEMVVPYEEILSEEELARLSDGLI